MVPTNAPALALIASPCLCRVSAALLVLNTAVLLQQWHSAHAFGGMLDKQLPLLCCMCCSIIRSYVLPCL